MGPPVLKRRKAGLIKEQPAQRLTLICARTVARKRAVYVVLKAPFQGSALESDQGAVILTIGSVKSSSRDMVCHQKYVYMNFSVE